MNPSASAQTITLDSRYFQSSGNAGYEFANSSRALTQYTNEWLWWYGTGWTWLSMKKPLLGNIPYFILSHSLNAFMMRNATTAHLHEFGHYRPLYAVGYNPNYTFDPTSDFTTQNFFAGHLFQLSHLGFNDASSGLPQLENGGEDYSRRFSFDGEEEYIQFDGGPSAKLGLISRTGGLNLEVYRPEQGASALFARGDFMQNFYTYMDNKLSYAITPEYPEEGDARGILQSYQELGIDVQDSDLVSAATNSFFLSGGSYAYLLGMLRYFTHNDGRVYPITIGRIMLPEFSHYMTTRGVTQKISTWAQINNALSLQLGFERVITGRSDTEFSVGANLRDWPEKDFSIYTWLNVNEGVDAIISADYLLNEKLKLRAGVDVFHSGNMHGERHIPTYKNGENFAQFWFSISYVFRFNPPVGTVPGTHWNLLKWKESTGKRK